MVHISTFVFFDIETTGLPWQERNQTKITELSFIAAAREDILSSSLETIPLVSKLCFPIQPEREIHQEVIKITGLTNDTLKNAMTFRQKVNSIVSFLEELPKPVCLVAHNGNSFDFKILLAEFIDAEATLPYDLLCVDSLVGFRKLLKEKGDLIPLVESNERDFIAQIENRTITLKSEEITLKPEEIELLTDDEDDLWPNLDVTTQDWQQIDELCDSLSDLSGFESDEAREKIKIAKTESIRRVFDRKSSNRNKTNKTEFRKKEKTVVDPNSKEGYSLSVLYKKLLNKEGVAHRAEIDCMMLLQCVIALKTDFIPWADNACKPLNNIKPLYRY